MAIAAAGALAPVGAFAASSREQAGRILAVALSVEYLQADLYAQAARAESIGPDLLRFAQVAAEHEQEHITALRALLGPAAGDPPRFAPWAQASDDEAFATAALRLEDLSVLALNGQAARLGPSALAVTARVASVDARHAAWLRGLRGITPSHHVRDTGWSAEQVSAALARNGFAPAPPL